MALAPPYDMVAEHLAMRKCVCEEVAHNRFVVKRNRRERRKHGGYDSGSAAVLDCPQ